MWLKVRWRSTYNRKVFRDSTTTCFRWRPRTTNVTRGTAIIGRRYTAVCYPTTPNRPHRRWPIIIQQQPMDQTLPSVHPGYDWLISVTSKTQKFSLSSTPSTLSPTPRLPFNVTCVVEAAAEAEVSNTEDIVRDVLTVRVLSCWTTTVAISTRNTCSMSRF